MLFLLDCVLASFSLSDFKSIKKIITDDCQSEDYVKVIVAYWTIGYIVDHLAVRLPEIKSGNTGESPFFRANINSISILDPVEHKDLIGLLTLFKSVPIDESVVNPGKDTYDLKKCRENVEKFKDYLINYPEEKKGDLEILLREVENIFGDEVCTLN